jgi:hypothetical protein
LLHGRGLEVLSVVLVLEHIGALGGDQVLGVLNEIYELSRLLEIMALILLLQVVYEPLALVEGGKALGSKEFQLFNDFSELSLFNQTLDQAIMVFF